VCDKCADYTVDAKAADDIHFPLLLAGESFMKYPHGRGRAGIRKVQLTPDHKKIEWFDPAKDNPKKKFMMVKDIDKVMHFVLVCVNCYDLPSELLKILVGQQTKSFKSKGKVGKDKVCFSITSAERTLDLQCKSEQVIFYYKSQLMLLFIMGYPFQVKEQWVTALQVLLKFRNVLSHDQIAQQQQEKAVAKKQAEHQQITSNILAERQAQKAKLREKLRKKYGLS